MSKKHICLDCFAMFNIEAAHKKEVPDHTGFDGIFIDVCPTCLSNHIQPTEGINILLLDNTDKQHLAVVMQHFINGCKQNLIRVEAQNIEPKDRLTLVEHYQSFITLTEAIFNNIKPCEN